MKICVILENYEELCDQMVKGQLGLIKKITVKDAWVNSVATGLPPAQCRDAGMDFYLNSPQKKPSTKFKERVL